LSVCGYRSHYQHHKHCDTIGHSDLIILWDHISTWPAAKWHVAHGVSVTAITLGPTACEVKNGKKALLVKIA